jgi:hypothetical protein
MKIGIIGLPNAGKSTLFNALTKSEAPAENFPFCTIEPNLGVVKVPDSRVDKLSKMYNPKKTTYTTVNFVDIAGLVKNASKGEGLGNQFLSHIRQMNACAHVIRCYEDENIIHVMEKIDPIDDIEIVHYELILSDLDMLERRIFKAQKAAKAQEKGQKELLELMEKIKETLLSGLLASKCTLKEDEREAAESLDLITLKPFMYIANVAEDEANTDSELYLRLKDYLKEYDPAAPLIKVSAKIEQELSSFDEEEKLSYLKELGFESTGLDKIIQAGYKLLNLVTFFTSGEDEVKAWTIEQGTKAPKAAGKIHSDIERGFIRAEVTDIVKLLEVKSESKAKELGYVRIEGKDYVVKDGDVIYFRFNV